MSLENQLRHVCQVEMKAITKVNFLVDLVLRTKGNLLKVNCGEMEISVYIFELVFLEN